jgi:hypothetical protein
MLSAQRFHNGIEAFAWPLQGLAQAMDGDPMGALRHPARGGPELVPQDGHVDQASFVFVRLEPLAERLAHEGITRGLDPARGFPPVEIAIEALNQLIGEADTEDARTLLLSAWHEIFL